LVFLVYIWQIYGHLVFLCPFWYTFSHFWFVVPRKIWQPWPDYPVNQS
jgi:hypothetical protein